MGSFIILSIKLFLKSEFRAKNNKQHVSLGDKGVNVHRPVK